MAFGFAQASIRSCRTRSTNVSSWSLRICVQAAGCAYVLDVVGVIPSLTSSAACRFCLRDLSRTAFFATVRSFFGVFTSWTVQAVFVVVGIRATWTGMATILAVFRPLPFWARFACSVTGSISSLLATVFFCDSL
jgi:hypothetical protein